MRSTFIFQKWATNLVLWGSSPTKVSFILYNECEDKDYKGFGDYKIYKATISFILDYFQAVPHHGLRGDKSDFVPVKGD